MSPVSAPERLVAGIAGHAAVRVREERKRRGWTLRQLAGHSGLSPSLVQWIEAGHAASLASYVRIGAALGLRTELDLIDPRRRAPVRAADSVHAAIVEALASTLSRPGTRIGVDEPYQHYQFAGRADILAVSAEQQALFHGEVRTQFPNLQEAFGSYNGKRRWLPASVADQAGLREGFRVVTHVVVALWSSEVLHAVRLHRETFRALCPDTIEPFIDWWNGQLPRERVTSSLVLFDPVGGGRRDRRRFISLDDALRTRPRYHDYAEAAAALASRGAVVSPGGDRRS